MLEFEGRHLGQGKNLKLERGLFLFFEIIYMAVHLLRLMEIDRRSHVALY